MKISTKTLTRTAVMLAVTLVFQSLRSIPFIGALPYSSYIIGSLVNLSLLITVSNVSIGSAILISIITPLVAFMQGYLKFAPLIPVIALSNIILCYFYYYLQKINKYAAIAIGAVGKWIFIFYAARFVLKNIILLPAEKLTIAIVAFNIPQLVTALIGGFLAVIISQMIKNNTR